MKSTKLPLAFLSNRPLRGLFFAILLGRSAVAWGQCEFTWLPQNPCPGELVTFTVTGPQSGHVYTFGFSGVGVLPVQGNTIDVNFPLNTAAQTYTVTLLDSVGNQQVCTLPHQILVKAAPNLTIGLVPQAGVSFQNGIIASCDGIPPGGLEIKIRNTTPAASVAQNVGYQFDWGDGTVLQNFTNATFSNGVSVPHTYTNQGSFPIKITVTQQNGCSWTYKYEFYSGSNPSVGLGNPGSTINLCPQETRSFPVTGTSGNSPGTQYLFQVNGVTVQSYTQNNIPANIAYTFTESSCGKGSAQNPNAYFVKIIAQNPCGSSEAQVGPITVSEAPTAVIGMTMPPNFCPGAEITFSNKSWGGAAVIQTSPGVFSCDSTTEQVEWSIATGINGVDFLYDMDDIYEQSIKVKFLKAGTYTITMKVLNQNSTCGTSMVTKTIVIAELPIADADALGQGSGNCAPKTIQFINKSLNSSALPAWSVVPTTGWHFQNPSSDSSNNPVLIFDQAGAYHIFLKVANPCGMASWDTTIVVQSAPVFTVALANINGCTPYDLDINPPNLTIASTGGFPDNQLTFQWTFLKPDNTTFTSTDKYPQNIPCNLPGTYTVTLTVGNGCGTTQATATFTLGQHPLALFGYPALADSCVSKTIPFINQSTGTNLIVAWPSIQGPPGGAAVSQTPNGIAVTFSVAGTYIVGLKVSNNCPLPNSSLYQDTLVFFDKPKITGFTTPAPCEGEKVVFSAASQIFINGGLPCLCRYQIPGILDQTVPCGQATPATTLSGTGPYAVTLTVSNHCGSATQTAQLNFAKKPVPGFIVPDKICLPAPLTGADTSHTFTASPFRKWTLHDAAGGTVGMSVLANPSFPILAPGDYTLQLAVGNGCDTLSITKLVHVFASPTAIAALANDQPCGSGSPLLTLNCTDGGAPVTVTWQAPGGNPASASGKIPPVLFYAQPGTYPITVTVDNHECPAATGSVVFTVADIPTADVMVAPRLKCLPTNGYTISFSLPAKPGVHYRWTVTRKNDGANPSSPYQFTGGTDSTFASPFLKIKDCGIYTYLLTVWNHCDTVTWMATDTFFSQPSVTPPTFPQAFCQQAVLDLSQTIYNFGCDPTATVTWDTLGQVISTELFPQNIQFSAPDTARTFTLSVTIDGVCGPSTASTTVQIDAPEALVLGPLPLVLCKNSPLVALAVNLGGGKWYLEGMEVPPVVNPAALTAGLHTFVYRKGSGACISTDSIVVTINGLPSGDAGADTTICVNLGEASLSPSFSTGATGEWTSSNPAVTLVGNTAFFSTPLTSKLTFTVTDTTTHCTNTDALILQVIPNTPLAVPSVFTLCNTPGPVPLPLTGNQPGLTFFGPGVTADGKHFDPALPGVGPANLLTWENKNSAGCIATGTMTVQLNALLAPGVLDAGPSVVLCQNGGIFVREGLPLGQAGLLWLDSLGNPISTTGVLEIDPSIYHQDFYLKVILAYLYDSPNCRQDDTLVLHIVYAEANAGADIAKCHNDPPFHLPPPTGLPPGFDYHWTPSDTIIPANGNGIATLHITGFGCDFSDALLVNVGELPGSVFVLDSPYCVGQVIDFQNNTPNASVQKWFDNDSLFSLDFDPQNVVLSAGLHTIRLVSWRGNCQDESEVTIFVKSPPILTGGPNVQEGCGPLSVVFTYAVAGETELFFEVRLGLTLVFTQPATGNSQTLILPDGLMDLTYTVSLVAKNECAITQIVTEIKVKARAISILAVSQDTLCSGEVLKVLPKSVNSVADTVLFGAIKVPTSITQTESFTVKNDTKEPVSMPVCLISENECNKDTSCYEILIYPAQYEAIAETHDDLSLICAGSWILLSGHATAGATTYWKNSHNTILLGDNVWVKAEEGPNEWVFFAAGCGYDSDTVRFSGHPAPQLLVTFPSNVCPGVAEALDITSNGAAIAVVLAPGDTIFGLPDSLVFQYPGVVPFTVIATSLEGCPTTIDTFLTVRPRPLIPFQLLEGCTVQEGYALLIQDASANTHVTSDLGYEQDGYEHLHLPNDTYYIHLIESTYGCQNDTTVYVAAVRQLTAAALPRDTTIELGQSIRLLVTAEYAESVSWSHGEWLDDPFSYEPLATPRENQCHDFVVTATDDRGCTATDVVRVCVKNKGVIAALPTAFSPNGDNVNDILYVRSINPAIVRIDFRVYDKWGELVFEAAGGCLPEMPGQGCGWDGNFRGRPADMGNYRAIVTFWYLDGTPSDAYSTLVRLIR